MSDYSYAGPRDQSTDGTNYGSLQFLVAQELAQVSTATFVQVARPPYDKNGSPITPGSAAAIGYVDVLPLVNQIDGKGNATPHGVVYHLSYYRYQGGNGAFISDPVKGDIGKMVVADRDTSAVRATGAQANPGSNRRFSKADGTYFGSVIAGPPGQYFAWTTSGFLIVDKNGNQIESGPGGVTINGWTFPISGGPANINTHVHSGVVSGGSDTGPPVT